MPFAMGMANANIVRTSLNTASAVENLSLFPAKKRNRKSSPLGKDAKSQRRRVSKFLCVSESLRLCVFNFLTRFLRGGRIDGKDQRFCFKPKVCCLLTVVC